MPVQLVKYTTTFLEYSWKWLSDPEIKRLTNTPSFSKESQIEWYNSIQSKTDYLIWGLEYQNNPIGVCGLKKITLEDCEYWGYIGEKEYWGKGIGKTMMNILEEKAKKLNLHSIWLQVLKENARAIALYEKSGYKIENEEGKLIFMRKVL